MLLFHTTLVRLRSQVSTLFSITILVLASCGCGPVAGNYPQARVTSDRCTARLDGGGFQLMAGSRLRVEKVEAELGSLRSQGFSRHDPQIVKSVARRSDVPPGLLADRSGSNYYRMTAQLDPGVGLTLVPGALEITLETENGTMVISDQGYLLEDRRLPGGCRLPPESILALDSSATAGTCTAEFLVRLPVRGEIVDLNLVPGRFRQMKDQGGR